MALNRWCCIISEQNMMWYGIIHHSKYIICIWRRKWSSKMCGCFPRTRHPSNVKAKLELPFVSSFLAPRMLAASQCFLTCGLTHPTTLLVRKWRVSKEEALAQTACWKKDYLFSSQEQFLPGVNMLNVIHVMRWGGGQNTVFVCTFWHTFLNICSFCTRINHSL